MAKQNQATEAQAEKKKRPKVEPAVGAELDGELIGLAEYPFSPISAAGGGSIQAQAAWLGDPRLQGTQRRALAARIGRVQGNQHLQRVVASLKRDGQRETGEDRSKSASVVSPNTIQRNDLFDPQISSVPGHILASLNREYSHRVRVRNARQAPAGTTFRWRWAGGPGDFDTSLLEPGAVPPEGPRATLGVKLKEIFSGQTTVTPELEVTHPGGEITTKQAPSISISAVEPTVIWTRSISTGGGGEGRERGEERLFVGDTLEIGIWFDNVGNAQTAGIDIAVASLATPPREGIFAVSEVHWDSPNEARLTVEARAAGSRTMWVNVFVPGMGEPIIDEFEITAVNDPEQFKSRLVTAGSTVDYLFNAARTYFLTCSENYKAGYDAHKAVLDAEGARQQLRREIIFAVLTGVAGGAVGGAVGVAAGSALARAGAKISEAMAKAAEGAVTDVAKNLTNYAVTMPLRRTTAGGAATEPGVPFGEGPGRPEGAAGRGRGAPAAEDPFAWHLGIERALSSERSAADLEMVRMNAEADYVRNFRVDFDFEIDPVELVRTSAVLDGTPLDQLGEPPPAAEYEKAFWATWLSQYAYRVVPFAGGGPGERALYRPEMTFGEEMLAAIDRVARSFGESGAQWLEEYGGISRERAERAAEQLTYPEIYGEYRRSTE